VSNSLVWVFIAATAFAAVSAPSIGVAAVQGYEAQPGTFSGNVSGSFQADIYAVAPANDQVSGSVTFTYHFQRPTRPPLSTAQCNPAAPVLAASGCARNCAKKDDYFVYQSGPLTGVPVIKYSPSCNAGVSGSVTPMGTGEARMACEDGNHWGGSTVAHVVMRVGPLYHFNNPRTWRTGFTWHYSNVAELLWPYVTLATPVQIRCHSGPRLQVRPLDPGPVLVNPPPPTMRILPRPLP